VAGGPGDGDHGAETARPAKVERRPNDNVRGGKPISRNRAIIFVVMAIGLFTLAAFGVLRADSDVDVTKDEAIATAVAAIDFEPETVDARLIREGFVMQPVWAVSLSVPTNGGGPEDFDELATVEIDARNGEIIRVSK